MSAFDVPAAKDPIPPLPPEQKSTNAWAVTSLICALVFCVPVVHSLLAVLFGLLGLRKSSDPRYGGRAMSLVGLALGVLGLAAWSSIGYFFYWSYQQVVPLVRTSEQFMAAVHSGDADAALALADPSLDRAKVEALIEKVKPLGQFQSFQMSSFGGDQKDEAGMRFRVGGIVRTATGTRIGSVDLVGPNLQQVKVADYDITP
jgi:hypothetical protein